MTNRLIAANQSKPVLSLRPMQAQPKSGQFVQTSGQCFNAATTDIIRTSLKALAG